jgi:cytochrome c
MPRPRPGSRPRLLLLAATTAAVLGLVPPRPPPTALAQDLAGHGGPVRALAVLEAPAPPIVLASAGFDHAVILWDPGLGRALRVLRWHAGAVNALLPLPGGGFASAGEDGRIALWPAPGGLGEAPVRVLEGHAVPVAGLALGAAAGGMLASAGWDGTVRLWPGAAAMPAGTRPAPPGGAAGPAAEAGPILLEGHAGPVNAVVALGAGGGFASAGHDGTLRLWEPQGGGGWAGRLLAGFGTPQNALLALPEGAAAGTAGLLAAGGADGAVRLVAADGTAWSLEAGTRPVVALALSPDGRTLAAATLGGSVTLWSLPEGRLRHTLQGPGQPFWAIAFSPDGRSLWTGGQDRRVRRWDAATGAPLGPLAPGGGMPEPAGAEAEAARAEPHGARVWRACAACHALTAAGAPPMAGPHLHGLFGRRMGGLAGYAYSERLARGDITWTPATVADLFTRGPEAVVPGTKMPEQTVGEPSDLAALMRFLEIATR